MVYFISEFHKGGNFPHRTFHFKQNQVCGTYYSQLLSLFKDSLSFAKGKLFKFKEIKTMHIIHRAIDARYPLFD